MAYYFLKANIDGVEIEFNTKDKNIVQSQLDEYFEVILGKAPAPKYFETSKDAVAITEERANELYQEQYVDSKINDNNYTDLNNDSKKIEPKFSLGNFETENYIADENTYVAKPQTQDTTQNNSDFEYSSEIVNNEKSKIEYDNLEIQKENIYKETQTQNDGLNLYQPKIKPELFEFMQNKHSQGIFDDFIITAYFIKNVLGKRSFSVKFLNSKLYSAKEKLVDFAILNDAIQRGYIDVYNLSDSIKEYSITKSGEGYFFSLDN